VDFHLERGLRLHTEPEYKSLYRWGINEIDAEGRKIGIDQIPWRWTLRFTATSCVLGDNIEVKSQLQKQEATPAPPKIEQRQVIRVQLRPGSAQDDGNYHRQTTYSMFGTDRTIKDFRLDIHPIADPAEQEGLTAWGCVSYTTEIDFRNEKTEDCIVFYLYVKPETFAYYASKIAHCLLDEMILSVGEVDGFYSEWSPSISTRNVKVLTKYTEQNITLPPDHQREPPRLGPVGEGALYIDRRLEFGKRPEPEAVEEKADIRTEQAVPSTPAPAVVDPQMLPMLRSLRRAAWSVVCLLALIFIATLMRR
jgi:hypothetical protein